MKHWWESAAPPEPEPERPKAVAYYRHSAQDRQENSIPIQQDQVREWAEKHGFEIIQEYADAGKSGLNAEGRPAFTEMMEESREQAIQRMIQQAEVLGADAIVGVRLSSSAVAQGAAEVTAYGTAVKLI